MARPRRLRLGFIILSVLLVALVVWAVIGAHKTTKPVKNTTVPVTVAKASVRDVPLSISAIGAAQAWQGVLIRTQVNGKLLAVDVREGSYVAKGALLAEIDPAPYRAVLLQTQGALKRDQALLKAARVDMKRYQTLARQDSIAKQQVDTQEALVEQDEGVVLIDQGAVDAAEVNVNYCKIRSPVAGRVGVRLVDPGNIVSTTDTTGIVTVNQVMPIAVTFTVPQGDFQRLSDVSDNFTRPMATRALSQETGDLLSSGVVSIADNHVDPSTGTVAMKARFDNTDKHLWPGQFVNVGLTLETVPHATVIPAAAVNQGPNGAFVYVVSAARKAVVRPVMVLATQDTIAVIKSGVQPGDTVVTDGQMLLKPGATVAVRQANGGVASGASKSGHRKPGGPPAV
jgi:multidrug efflux system membrane fusion protein